ncbi:MAG: hypothetical protein AAF638_00895 [Pseudomonadota bacterium]
MQIRHCAAAAVLALVPMTAQADTNLETLAGTWASIACEVRPQPNQDGTMGEWWLTRTIEFSGNTITAAFVTYAGPGCAVPLHTLSFEGTFDVVGESEVFPGAIEADLKIDGYVRFTPMAQGFADFLNTAPDGSCGTGTWAVGESQDVLETGCSVLGLKGNDPTVEYEVLAVDGDHVYFGARPVDGTFITSPDKRPSALLVPAKRQ